MADLSATADTLTNGWKSFCFKPSFFEDVDPTILPIRRCAM
jgi:hypothetical protein